MTGAEFLATARKSVMAGVSAGLAAAAVALQDGVITTAEWVTIGVAALAGAGITYQVPNAIPTAEAAEVEVLDDEPGKHAADS